MDDFLSKPFKAQELGEMLFRWLNAPRETDAADRSSSSRGKTRPDASAPSIAVAQACPTLDQAVLDRLRAELDEAFGELVDAYIFSSPDLIGTLAQAIAQADSVSARIHAHGLKSSSALYGALRLAKLCEGLENQAAEGDLTDAGVLYAAIEKEFAEVVARLNTCRSQP